MYRQPVGATFAALGIGLVAAAIGALLFGAASIPWSELPGLVASRFFGERVPAMHEYLFWELRLPRVLLAGMVGSSLAVAGAMMQGLFRNPLADPGLIGVSSGAALGAVLAIVLGDQIALPAPLRGAALVPIAALTGAWLATLLIFRLGSRQGTTSVATLLLAGIAVNAFAGAVIGLCTFLADDAQLRSLNFWMLGSLGSASWSAVVQTLPFAFAILVAAPGLARPLNALALGESEAGHLGFRPQQVKVWVVALAAIGVGGCVAQAGMIGFVGLVVPHLLRLLIGPDHRWLIPGSALLGDALLILADTISRTLVAPAEMPIGILTAAVGSPFFLALLMKLKPGGIRP